MRHALAPTGEDPEGREGEWIIAVAGTVMNKERLDWVMSGLNQHALTKAEDQFLKTASEDFDKNHALTERQEDKVGKPLQEEVTIDTQQEI